LLYFAIDSRNFSFLLFAVCINGFTSIAILAMAYELGVEVSYPVDEALSASIINTISCTLSFILVISMTPILDIREEIDVLISCIILGSILIVSLIMSYSNKLEFKRSEFIVKSNDIVR
jgi:hypothetical protein